MNFKFRINDRYFEFDIPWFYYLIYKLICAYPAYMISFGLNASYPWAIFHALIGLPYIIYFYLVLAW